MSLVSDSIADKFIYLFSYNNCYTRGLADTIVTHPGVKVYLYLILLKIILQLKKMQFNSAIIFYMVQDLEKNLF